MKTIKPEIKMSFADLQKYWKRQLKTSYGSGGKTIEQINKQVSYERNI